VILKAPQFSKKDRLNALKLSEDIGEVLVRPTRHFSSILDTFFILYLIQGLQTEFANGGKIIGGIAFSDSLPILLKTHI